MSFGFYMPTRIFFGEGSVKKLARAKLPAGKGLIITGGTSTTKLGYVDKVASALLEGGHETIVFNNVQPNPTIEGVRECVRLARENACTFVVGLGGGSSIDTAKAAAVMATNEGDLWDYVFGGTGKAGRIASPALPIVAVTTTAGTGTEADPFAVITNGDEKIGMGWDMTFPAISIVDPDFMTTVPAKLTAYQGFDALFHACEGYIATNASPISEMFSLKSIELLGKHLPLAITHGEDKNARTQVALANTLSGFVETLSSCTSEHAIEHALSAYHPELPHGAGLIMLSRAYFTAFADTCADKFIDMARALGKADATNPMDFVTALLELQKACGVDALAMSDYNIDAGDFGKYADNAFANMGMLFRVDARKLTREDVIAILKNSYR